MTIDAVVEQSTERLGAGGEGFASNHVRVALQDREGRVLERDDLGVEMNDTVLSTRNNHDHFYERHPFYRLDDASAHLVPNLECRFAIVRPDGTNHPAGVVRTPKAITPAHFEFPAVISRRAPVSIAWTDLPESAELVIFRSYAFTDLAGNPVIENGSRSDAQALRRTIGPGVFRRASGRLDIPASYLANPPDGRHVCSLGVEITVTHHGEIFAPFSRHSVIRAIRRLTLHADVVD